MFKKIKKYFEEKNSSQWMFSRKTTADMPLKCNKCHKEILFITPTILEFSKNNNRIIPAISKIAKYCPKCKAIYLGIEKNETWIFKKEWWKKLAPTLEKLIKGNITERIHSFEKLKLCIEEIKTCTNCSKTLKEYKFDCLECSGKMAFPYLPVAYDYRTVEFDVEKPIKYQQRSED